MSSPSTAPKPVRIRARRPGASNRFLLLLLAASLAVSGTAAQDVSDIAYSLNLTSLHSLSMPTSRPQDALNYISKEWDIWNDRLYGGNESTFNFVSDPFSASSGNVSSVLYPEGSYRQTPMSQVPTGGLTMYPSLSDSEDSEEVSHALLSYKVAFQEGFQWNKGGKLPGLWSGKEGKDCSGGNQSGDEDCWSVRLMWRGDGVGEVYAYLPLENDLCAGAANATLSNGASVICNEDYGTSIGRGTFNLTGGQYTEVSLYVAQNTLGLSDGSLQLWVDSKPVIRLDDIIFRKKVSNPTRIFFSTFFGGSTSDWASPQTQRSYFKDLQVWLNPAELRTVDAESSGIASFSASSISLVVCSALSLLLVLYARSRGKPLNQVPRLLALHEFTAQDQHESTKSLDDENDDEYDNVAAAVHRRNSQSSGRFSKRQSQEGSSGSDSSQDTQSSNNDREEGTNSGNTVSDSSREARTSQAQPTRSTTYSQSGHTSDTASQSPPTASQSNSRDDPSEDTLPLSRTSSFPPTSSSTPSGSPYTSQGDPNYTPTSSDPSTPTAGVTEETTQKEPGSQSSPFTSSQGYTFTSSQGEEETTQPKTTSSETSGPTSVTGTASRTTSRFSDEETTQTSFDVTVSTSSQDQQTSSQPPEGSSSTFDDSAPSRSSISTSMEESGGYSAADEPQETGNGSGQDDSSQQPTRTRGGEDSNDNDSDNGGSTSQPRQTDTQRGNDGDNGEQTSQQTQDQPTTTQDQNPPQTTTSNQSDDNDTSVDDNTTTTTSQPTQTQTQQDPDTTTTSTQVTTSRTSRTDVDTSTLTSSDTTSETATQTRTQSESSTSNSSGTGTTSAELSTGTTRGTLSLSDSAAVSSSVQTASGTTNIDTSKLVQSPSSASGGNAATAAQASAAKVAVGQTASADAAPVVSIGQQVLPTSAATELSRLSDIFQPTPTTPLSDGESVYFSTGTDANGQPTTLTTTTRGRNPFLNNDTGGGISTSGKIVAGTVTGIIMGIIVIAAIVWMLGKRRRNKFVKPIVERLHTTGSAYSLPGLLSSGGSGGGTAAQRRRSRAFSIESADTYTPVSFENGGDLSSPERWSPSSRPIHHRQMSSGPDMSQIYRDDPSDNGYFLPAGAAPYRARSRSHRTYPSSGSALTPSSSEQYLSDVARSQHKPSGSTSTHATTVLGYDDAGSSPKASTRKPQLAIHLAPSQQELLYPSSSPLADDRSMTESPLYSDNPPLPKSPTLQPTLLQRRTTDPFGVKHSLRVINPDVRNSGQITASIVSPTSISRTSTPSVITTDNEFYYDEPVSSARGQAHKPMHLDLARPIRPESAMSNGSVYTPNQVDQVGFFRGD